MTLENPDDAKKIIDNSHKHSKAPDHLKRLSINYDSSKDERKKIRELVAQAKEQSENDPNYVFKVRGPPWNPYIQDYLRKKNTPT